MAIDLSPDSNSGFRNGSFHFASPEVPTAYEPSGKGTAAGLALMLAVGAPVGLALGVAAHFLQFGLFRVLAEGFDHGGFWSLMAFCGAFVVILMSGVLAGVGTGTAIGWAAIKGKSRSLAHVSWVAAGGGGLAVATYLFARHAHLGTEAFDSGSDGVKCVLTGLVVLLSAVACARSTLRSRPFCEPCDAFMARHELPRAEVDAERTVLSVLQRGDYEGLVQEVLPADGTIAADHCAVVVWSCESCRASGIVEATTKLSHVEHSRHGSTTRNAERRIFSARIDGAAIAVLSRARAGEGASPLVKSG